MNGTSLIYDLNEAPAERVDLLGGKGAGLARMAADGVPVPHGFVLTTECGRHHLSTGELPPGLDEHLRTRLDRLGDRMGRRFGDPSRPLLVSVRSGAPVSMPGMMDTVLNVGLTADGVAGLVEETGDACFAYSCFERLLDSFARTVRGVTADAVEEAVGPPSQDHEAEERKARCDALLGLIAAESGTPFPDAHGQVLEAVEAVFRSWDSRRAKAYRRHKKIDDAMGTAVVVQSMVFGNRGNDSGSGVVFTRDPATGAPGACGEFLLRAQGEDVVSGEFEASTLADLREHLPSVADELDAVLDRLERSAQDMCDVEFTVERGRLWVLQTRVGQRSGRAALRIAIDLADEGLISRAEAVRRVEERGVDAVTAPAFASEPPADLLVARGVASSPGAVTGVAAFDPERAQELSDTGECVVLVRPTTSPADLQGLLASVGVVTGRGGPMSHAAVVARGLDRPAVCGVGAVVVGPDLRSATVAGQQLREGDLLSLDGDRGVVARGTLEFRSPEDDPVYRRFLEWRSSTDTPRFS